jgi:nitrate reductase NapAB chaperone NapD
MKFVCRCRAGRKFVEVRATLMVDSQEAKASAKISDTALNLAFPDGEKRELKRPLPGFDSIESALREFADGKFVVVLDNEDRENEGDLIMAADKVLSIFYKA